MRRGWRIGKGVSAGGSPSGRGEPRESGEARLRQLEDALREAQEALGSRDEFLRLVGHELRGPLAAIQLQADALGMLRDSELGPEEVRRRADRVGRQVQRLAWLLDEVLDLARASSGRLSLVREDVDMVALVDRALVRVQDEVRRAGCEAQVRTPAVLGGSWDPARLERAIGALLSRSVAGVLGGVSAGDRGSGAALGAGGARGATIEAGVAVVEVVASEESSGSLVQLVVRGVASAPSPEEEAVVAGSFEKAVAANRPGAPMLALWLARLVIEAHGGTMQIGGAGRFESIVRLPRA